MFNMNKKGGANTITLSKLSQTIGAIPNQVQLTALTRGNHVTKTVSSNSEAVWKLQQGSTKTKLKLLHLDSHMFAETVLVVFLN